MATMRNQMTRTSIMLIGAALLAIGLFVLLNLPDRRTPGEHVGDAIDTFSETGNIAKAGRELEKRTPGERIGDAVNDATK